MVTLKIENGWRKSSRSTNDGQCVEMKSQRFGKKTKVRDSKNKLGPILNFDADAWTTFTSTVRDTDRFDA